MTTLLIVVFIANMLLSTGFFRGVENKFDGKILAKIPLSGAEDIMISQSDSFALISATARLDYPPKEQEIGGLYLIDLKTKNFKPIHLSNNFNKPFAPHGISYYKTDNNYRIITINHTTQGNSVEVFDLIGKELTHIKTITDPSIVHPNDLVMIDENRFYLTNDHRYTKGVKKLFEEYSGLELCNVVYYDGNKFSEAATNITYANGINYDPYRKFIYVASPRKFLIKVYNKNEDGSLTFVEDIPCGTGVDNIDLDKEGNLWVGAHPNLLRFSMYSKGVFDSSPSEIIKVSYRAKGDYSVESLYEDEGKELSASTVAATFGKMIFVGSVKDSKFLVLERN